MSSKILIIAVFLSLLGSFATVDWQGYGNMSSSNLTDIWTYINSTIGTQTANSLEKYSVSFSTHLNGLWDTAWNVVIVNTVAQKDAVLYGYAFRDHWMWYNGYRINNLILTFVIWKDYNCQNWFQFGSQATPLRQSGFSTLQKSAILSSRNTSANTADIWRVAKQFVNTVAAHKDIVGDKAFSLVLAQGGADTTIYGQICIFGTKYDYSFIDLADYKWGRYILFQTR